MPPKRPDNKRTYIYIYTGMNIYVYILQTYLYTYIYICIYIYIILPTTVLKTVGFTKPAVPCLMPIPEFPVNHHYNLGQGASLWQNFAFCVPDRPFKATLSSTARGSIEETGLNHRFSYSLPELAGKKKLELDIYHQTRPNPKKK